MEIASYSFWRRYYRIFMVPVKENNNYENLDDKDSFVRWL